MFFLYFHLFVSYKLVNRVNVCPVYHDIGIDKQYSYFYNEDEYVSSSDIRKKRKEIGDAYVKSGYFIQGFLEGQQAFCGFIQHGLIRRKTGHSS